MRFPITDTDIFCVAGGSIVSKFGASKATVPKKKKNNNNNKINKIKIKITMSSSKLNIPLHVYTNSYTCIHHISVNFDKEVWRRD